MRPALRHILLWTKAATKYLLRATFDAADQAYANAQVLDTQAEGIQDGTLTCVIVDGTLAISGNKCAFTAPAVAAWGKLGFYSQAITRALGRGVLGTVNKEANDKHGPAIFWNSAADCNIATIEGVAFYFRGTGNINVPPSETPGPDLVAYAASTNYKIAVILGGHHSNSAPWYSGQSAASYLYGVALYLIGGVFANWTLLWRDATENTATLYVALGTYTAAGTLDNFRVPNADLSAVLQPTHLSLFATDGELDAYVPEVGGMWTENTGDWDTAGGVLRNTLAGICSFNPGIADLIYDVKVTMPASGTTPGGLIVRGSDFAGVDDDYWVVRLIPGTAGTDFQLIEVNAGVETVRASADVDWVASTAYNVRVIVAGNNYWKVYVDGVEKLTYTTINTFNQTATLCGLRDQGNANFVAFDNAAVFARTSSVYDSTLGGV